MRKLFLSILLLLPAMGAYSQRTLSLDSCRALAMRNNKQLLITRDKLEAAGYEHKAARTAYLPKLSLDGSYIYNDRTISLLNDNQKGALTGVGTKVGSAVQQNAAAIATQFPQLVPLLSSLGTQLVPALNQVGNDILDAFRTNTHNIYVGSLVLTQPLFLGGRIRAYDHITNYAQQLVADQQGNLMQEVILSTDQAYWQVVSLANKKKLAESYLKMLQKLDDDVQKLYTQGVATKSNELTVRVKLNEAEMTLTKVDDGLSLSKMLLCQLCGLDITGDIHLADEERTDLGTAGVRAILPDTAEAFRNRGDLQALDVAARIAEENVKLVRGTYLPSLSLIGGYTMMNPSVYNGFENKFKGNLSVGVTLHVPLWRWNEGKYHVQSAQAEARSVRHLYDDAREKITLQINQSKFKVNEANKKLTMANKDVEKANENLRYADVGFREGVITTSDMLEAQTAWLQARSEKIDAEIEIKITEACLLKSLGNLSAND